MLYAGAATLVAAGADALVVPCGRAFELVHNATNATGGVPFTCLFEGDKNCTLDAGGELDHPSTLGTYLAACTFAHAHEMNPWGSELQCNFSHLAA